MRVLITFLLLSSVCCTSQGYVPKNWFLIAASDKSVNPLIETKKNLGTKWKESDIIQSSDCKNFTPGLYVLVAGKYQSQNDAKDALAALKPNIADAYIKQCEIREKTLLAYNLPVIHPSIANVPVETVNWTDEDRVSQLHRLKDDYYFMEEKIYLPQPEDPWEGRRTQIDLFNGRSMEKTLIEENCFDFGGMVMQKPYAVFQCAHVIAGEHYIHRVVVVDVEQKTKLKEISYCGNPAFKSATVLTCDKESVNAEGELATTTIEISL